MDRVYSQDDRIRRAEEIYARRQNMRIARERTRRATVNVNNKPRNFRVFKKLILQIVICILIYFIFYLINTTSYSFSNDVLGKTKNLLSYDYDFYGMFSTTTKSINDFFNKSINKDDQNQENESQNIETNTNEESPNITNQENSNESAETLENNENVGNNENTEDESLTQTEIAHTEESDIERIKHTYSFGLPVSGWITSEFGDREVTSSVVTAYHKGIDIGANTGTPIYASTDGEVIISRKSPSYRELYNASKWRSKNSICSL